MKFRNPFVFKDNPPPPMIEVGATGTIFFSGIVTGEEYNTDLQGDKALTVYDKMRRSDGQVKGALLACELPLRVARWDIQPASDDSLDQEVAQFVRDNLFDGMSVTWDDFLHHALLMLPFGFSVFEKVWELKDGLYKWRKFAPRLPRTIQKWYTDPEGGLKSIEQWAFKDGKYQYIPLSIEKILVFTNEREGSNYQGISLLRAAYKHWYFKNQLYIIDGIAAERHGVGLAVFHYPDNAPETSKDKLKTIGEQLHTHERSYMSLPESIAFDLKGVAGQLHDIKGSIEHHDLQITRSILAQFINLGSGKHGSYALSQDQSGFFLMALMAIGRNIENTFNRYAIKQLVDYNWSVEKYPKLFVSDLEFFDIAKYSKAITELAKAGALVPDEGVENELRRQLRLPARRPGAEPVVKKPPGKKTTEEQPKKAFRTPGVVLAEFNPWRPLRGYEAHVAFAEINNQLTITEEEFIQAAQAVQQIQVRAMVDTAVKHIQDGNVSKAAEMGVPNQNTMQDALANVLLDMFEYGREEIRKEAQRQGATIKAQEPIATGGEGTKKAFIKSKAKAIAAALAAKMQAALSFEALRQIRVGIVDRNGLTAVLTVLSGRELRDAAKISVAEALNLGRQEQAQDMANEIDHVEYSALLDEGTCGPCETLDGTVYAFPSDEWDEVNPPYKNCEGQDRCRCVGVFVFKTEIPSVR